MTQLTPLERAPSVAERVYDSLKSAITSLALRPGEPIVEARVARQLSVSTTPVREALQRLAQEDLVVLGRYRGASVVHMTERDVREIYQIRATLEPLAARLAVPALTDLDLAGMEESIHHASLAITRREWEELSYWNRRFHGTFIRQCDNARLRRILENLQDHNRLIALLTWEDRGYDEHEHEEHLAILEAAVQRKADLTEERVHQHIARFGKAVIEIWSRRYELSASTD